MVLDSQAYLGWLEEDNAEYQAGLGSTWSWEPAATQLVAMDEAFGPDTADSPLMGDDTMDEGVDQAPTQPTPAGEGKGTSHTFTIPVGDNSVTRYLSIAQKVKDVLQLLHRADDDDPRGTWYNGFAAAEYNATHMAVYGLRVGAGETEIVVELAITWGLN
jgi:hypothetical protein